MGLVIHQEKISEQDGKLLCELCPFGAISYDNNKLAISSSCKLCKMCVKRGPAGAITYEEEKTTTIDKSLWRGICVFAEQRGGAIHAVSKELLGKAKELAKVNGDPVYALLIGYNLGEAAKELLCYGADKVFVYDDEQLKDFVIGPYANAFEDFINKEKPSSILVGATSLGRSLAPKVAARMHTGLTADCTILQMKETTDLVQIRPAFGGNIMAQIVCPNTRPQFCTVRYKVFSIPEKTEPKGEIVSMKMDATKYKGKTKVLQVIKKPDEMDISESNVIVAVGRGVKSQNDLTKIEDFAKRIGAQMACTRPLVECGWFDAKHQIGLSGRTVKPKLIITLGISGAIQFVSGMRNSTTIISVNVDKDAPIFDVAHYGFVGDLYEILPIIEEQLKGGL